jgi:hypothetical protein
MEIGDPTSNVSRGPFPDPLHSRSGFDNDPVIIVTDPDRIHNMRMRVRIQHYRTFSFFAFCQNK